MFTYMIDNITFRAWHSSLCHFLDQHACEVYQTQTCDYAHTRIWFSSTSRLKAFRKHTYTILGWIRNFLIISVKSNCLCAMDEPLFPYTNARLSSDGDLIHNDWWQLIYFIKSLSLFNGKVPLQAVKPCGAWRYSSTLFYLWHLMEICD